MTGRGRSLIFVSAGVVLVGALWGLIWGLLTPGIEGRMVTADSAVATGDTSDAFVAIGVYFTVALIAGVILAVVFWMPPRLRGPAGVAGLAFGAIAAGIIAVWVGDAVARVRFPGRDGVPIDGNFTQAPSLRMPDAFLDIGGGIGFSWALLAVAPLTALLTYVVLIVMNRSGDLGYPSEPPPPPVLAGSDVSHH
ncbi:DUF2567 domain-containing protein [Williamsia sp.]|uniref:DUF2567 domain-containing protein n=1 Tax=Williamsia sp. TaxID=1872085 RepID=UPI002F928213